MSAVKLNVFRVPLPAWTVVWPERPENPDAADLLVGSNADETTVIKRLSPTARLVVPEIRSWSPTLTSGTTSVIEGSSTEKVRLGVGVVDVLAVDQVHERAGRVRALEPAGAGRDEEVARRVVDAGDPAVDDLIDVEDAVVHRVLDDHEVLARGQVLRGAAPEFVPEGPVVVDALGGPAVVVGAEDPDRDALRRAALGRPGDRDGCRPSRRSRA